MLSPQCVRFIKYILVQTYYFPGLFCMCVCYLLIAYWPVRCALINPLSLKSRYAIREIYFTCIWEEIYYINRHKWSALNCTYVTWDGLVHLRSFWHIQEICCSFFVATVLNSAMSSLKCLLKAKRFLFLLCYSSTLARLILGRAGGFQITDCPQ